jgi:RNA polymerase sigma-70 factor (ECF subfamily)
MDRIIAQTEHVPDELIIKKILGGEKNFFELIIRRYNQRMFRIGMSVLNNDAEAEDAMQTAYIKAYEHLHKFENRSSFSTWLTRIMLNECLAQKKKRQRFSNETEVQPENSTIMATPDHILMNKELNGILENAFSKLPDKYRLVFILREIEEMSVKETGELLEIEETNVKVRMNRAKSMLRENLKEYIKDHVYTFHLLRCDRMVNHVMSHIMNN